MHPTITNFEE